MVHGQEDIQALLPMYRLSNCQATWSAHFWNSARPL